MGPRIESVTAKRVVNPEPLELRMAAHPPAHLEAARRRANARTEAAPAGLDTAPATRQDAAFDDEDDEVTIVDVQGLRARGFHRLAVVVPANQRGEGTDEIRRALDELCVLEGDEDSMEAPAWCAVVSGAGAGAGGGTQAPSPSGASGGGTGDGSGAGDGGDDKGNKGRAARWPPLDIGTVGPFRESVQATLLQLIPADSAVWSELRDPLCMKVPREARPVLRDVINNPTPNAANVVSYLLSSTIYSDEMTAEGVYYRYLRVVSMFVGLACESSEPAQYDWRDVALELNAVRRDLAIVREIAQANVASGEGLVARAETQESVRGLLLKLLLGRDFRIERTVPLHFRLPDVLKAAIETPTVELSGALYVLADFIGPRPLPDAINEGFGLDPDYRGPKYDAARLVWCIARYVGEVAEPNRFASGSSVWNGHYMMAENLERDLNIPMQKRDEEQARRNGGLLAPLHAMKPQFARRILLIGALAASVPVFIAGALSAYLAAALGWLG